MGRYSIHNRFDFIVGERLIRFAEYHYHCSLTILLHHANDGHLAFKSITRGYQ